MQVPGYDECHLWVCGDDVLEAVQAREAGHVHVVEPHLEGGKVGEDESGSVRGCGERSFQPVGALVVEAAVVVVGLRGVDADEAYGVVVDHVAAVSLGEVARVAGQQVGEGLPEVGPVVVVARERQQGSGERLDDLTEAGVLLGSAVVGQVAGGEHHVGARVEPVEVLDDRSQRRRRVGQRGEGPVIATDVAVGDLGDEHGPRVGRSPVDGPQWLDTTDSAVGPATSSG